MNFDFLAKLLGDFLKITYDTIAFHNYGLAIIVFTILVKLLLLPFAVKQYNSMAKMQEIQPKVLEIQKRYKNDKEKLNIELMKVYKENNVNPAGGCLPLLVQMPIFIALYTAFVRPLTFMLGYQQADINSLAQALGIAVNSPTREIAIIKAKPDLIDLFFPTKSFGINLADTPSFTNVSILWIIPILAALTTYLSTRVTTPKTGAKKAEDATQSSMFIIFPIMTGLFAFQFPSGLGLYWIVTNLFQMAQQYLLNKTKGIKKEASVK